MTGMDDFEPTLAAWLQSQAPDQAPDRLLDGALQRVSQQPQRRGRLGRLDATRLSPIVRVSAVVAVVTMAAVLGLQFAKLTPGPGGPLSPVPSPSAPSALPSPSGSPLPTTSPTAIPTPSDCVNPPVDILSLSSQADPVACYGNESATVDGYLTRVGAIDGPCLFIEPAWLSCGSWIRLSATAADSATLFFAAIHPSAGTITEVLDTLGGLMGMNVHVTGHFDDPAAQNCRYVEGSGFPREEFTTAELVQSCRATFVVTTIASN